MKIREVTDAVGTFQKAFNLPFREIPTLVDEEEGALRFELMAEENEEYIEAVHNGSIIGVADALGDMLYILAGTIVTHGMQGIIHRVFQEIHHSNMSKLDDMGNPIINGQNGVLDTTRPLGKVLKSEKYRAPDLQYIVSSGIMDAKREASNQIYQEIMHEKFVIDHTGDESIKEVHYARIEDLNEELLKMSITSQDVNLQ